jgi:hypothetical protein
MVHVVSDSSVQYSNVVWKNGYKKPRNWNNGNQEVLILDLDDGITIAEAQKRFKRYTYILSTTKSHQIEKKGVRCDRFRVIIKAINISTDSRIYFKSLELFCPESDKQVLTKTASFLGNDNAIVIYNEARPLDMFYWSELAKEELAKEELDKIDLSNIDPDLLVNSGSNSIQDVKEQLTYEIVVDVLNSCGYEVSNGAFRLRSDERTASCRVKFKSLNIKDYGGTFGGDIFQLLMEYQGMSFGESIRYVRKFI